MSLKTVELEAGEEFKLPPLDGRLLAPRVYTETFYDTARGRLEQAGFTLSRRLENGQGIWRLRVTCDGASTLDLEALGGPAEPPDELRELITAASAGFTLAPAARVRTRSTNLRVKAGSRSLARIDVAWIAVLDGQRPARSFCQIELEPLAADRKELARLEKALRKAGAKPANGAVPSGGLSSARRNPSCPSPHPPSIPCARSSASSTHESSRTTQESGSGRIPRTSTSFASRSAASARSSGLRGRSWTGPGWTTFAASSRGSPVSSAPPGTSTS